MRTLSRRSLVRGGAVLGGYSLTRLPFAGRCFADTRPYVPGSAPPDGVVLRGRVSYEGKIPKPVTREVTADFAVAGRGARQWEGLNLGDQGGVAAAVVVVNGLSAGKPFSEGRRLAYAKDAMILERSGVFGLDRPEVELEFENQDPIMHSWVVRHGQKQLANVAQIPRMPPLKFKVKQPGLYELTCGPHPWERAFRMVVAHPYYALTGPDGKFEIGGVPRGRYTVTIWAEGIEATDLPVDCGKDPSALEAKLTAANLSASLRKNLG